MSSTQSRNHRDRLYFAWSGTVFLLYDTPRWLIGGLADVLMRWLRLKRPQRPGAATPKVPR